VPNPDTQDYLLKGVPRDLWKRAQAKAKAMKPPMSMRWALLLMLEEWVGGRDQTHTNMLGGGDNSAPVF